MSRQYNNRNCAGCAANSDRIRILENRISFLERNLPNKTSTPIPRRSRSLNRRGKSPNQPRDIPPRFRDNKTPESTPNQSTRVHKLPISSLPIYTPSIPQNVPQVNHLQEAMIPAYGYQPQWQYQGAPPDGGSGGYYYACYPHQH